MSDAALLCFDERHEAPREFPLRCGDAVVFARPNADKQVNEDSVGVFDVTASACVLAVADGVGGAARGQDASRIAIEALHEHLAGVTDSSQLRPLILDAFETAQRDILALGTGAATTLAVAEVSDGLLRSYHTGDSGVFLTGRGGKLKLKTVFHSPSGYAEESGLITEEDALLHEERHFVSNLLGTPQMSVELSAPVPVARFDTLVLGSDGLFDNLAIGEITDTVRKGRLPDAGERLLTRVDERMRGLARDLPSKPDDLSYVLFRRRG